MDKPVNKKNKVKETRVLPKELSGIYEKIYEYENIKTAITDDYAVAPERHEIKEK